MTGTLTEYFAKWPEELRELKKSMPKFEEGPCYPVGLTEGGPAAAPQIPRLTVYLDGQRRSVSYRRMVMFVYGGEDASWRSRPECCEGCVNPHHQIVLHHTPASPVSSDLVGSLRDRFADMFKGSCRTQSRVG